MNFIPLITAFNMAHMSPTESNHFLTHFQLAHLLSQENNPRLVRQSVDHERILNEYVIINNMDLQVLQPCKIILVITNYAIVAYLFVLIYKHISSQNDLKSFSFIFHVMCTIWLFVRGLFWISTLTTDENWTPGSYYFLYWMPVPIEFASFLLFPLYFIQVIYPVEWREYEDWLIPSYVFVVAILLSCQAIFIIVDLMYQNETARNCGRMHSHLPHECFEMDINNQFFRAITACCFCILATIQSVYALKLHTVSRIRYERFLACSQETMFYVNCVLVASFASRSLYQILAMFDVSTLPDVPLSVDGDCPLVVFLFFELWDYVPTILLITTITAGSISDDTAAYRNRNINEASRQLWDPKTSYGTVDAADEEEQANEGDVGSELPEHASELGGMSYGGEIEISRKSGRSGSISKRDGSNQKKDNSYDSRDSQNIKDQAAHIIVDRFTNPTSLIPTDSSLMVKEAARSWVASTPPSNPGSYSNNNNNASAAGSIHMYALAHAYTSANSAHSSGTGAGGKEGMSVSIPQHNNNSGGYAIPGANIPDSTVSSTPSTVGSITSHSHSLLERNSGLLAYHAKQLQAAAAQNAHHETSGSSSHDAGDHPLHQAFVNHRGLIPRSYSVSSTEGTSNRPLKPVHSPKSSTNHLPRPSFSTSNSNNNVSSSSIGIGDSADHSLGMDLTSNSLAIDTTFSASSDTAVQNATNNQPHTTNNTSASVILSPAYPVEENEWQVEPGTSHTDAPSLLHTMNAVDPSYTTESVRQSASYVDYTHSVHAQPRYLQEDYQQFQLQQQALHQQRVANNNYHSPQHNNLALGGVPNVFGPGYDFSSHNAAHIGTNMAHSPSTYNTTVHVHITSPVQSHHTLNTTTPHYTTTTTYSTTNTTTLAAPVPGGSYILPLQVPVPIVNLVPHIQQPYIHPSHVPSPFSGTDRSVGSLEFSNDTSPSLHGLSSSYGNGNTTNRSQYQYEEHSVADSGIGMGNLPLSRTHSGVSNSNASHTNNNALHGGGSNSAPNSPQLRTMAPCPRRPNFNVSTSRQLGFDTPSPRRQLSGNSNTGSFNSNSMFDRDGTTSFSPSFIAELETEREGYFLHHDGATAAANPPHLVHMQTLHELQAQQAQAYHTQHLSPTGHTINRNATTNSHNPSHARSGSNSNMNSRRALQVSTPERQEVARANALIREDHSKDKFGGSY